MTCIKNKLINKYNWIYECSNCKLSEWMGQKIPIEVDHINGVHTDNRMENLRFLCPNCHALTDTYKGKNIKNKEHSKKAYENIKFKTICSNCGNKKYKNAEYCNKCYVILKSNKISILSTNSKDRKTNECIDCKTKIQKESERCIECYKKAKRNGIFEKAQTNTVNKKKCADCDKLVSKTSMRCRLCHYALMKSKTEIGDKEKIKGKCIDCNTDIDPSAVRCLPCSNNIMINANKGMSKQCIDCNISIWNTATRCVECHLINSRKVERPTYQQLLIDKQNMNMVQIGNKYGVSDNTIRKWIKKYNQETILLQNNQEESK